MIDIGSLIERTRNYGDTSFAELEKFDGYERGEAAVIHSKYENLVFWAGMSEDIAEAISDAIAQHRLVAVPCHFLVYLVDGVFPKMPIAKRVFNYKKPHWLPAVLKVPYQREA